MSATPSWSSVYSLGEGRGEEEGEGGEREMEGQKGGVGVGVGVGVGGEKKTYHGAANEIVVAVDVIVPNFHLQISLATINNK